MIQKKHQIETFRGSMLKTLVIGGVTTFYICFWQQSAYSYFQKKLHNAVELSTINSIQDEKTLVFGSRDNTAKENVVYGGFTSFSPDGQTIASASFDNTVKLWSIDGRELRTLNGHRDKVLNVIFSPDGKTIASASSDKTVKLWRRNGRELTTLTGHTAEVWGVAFSPDGERIASASSDKTVKLWRRDGKLLQTLKGHTAEVWDVTFSSDGKTIASGSSDKTIKLWDLATGKQLKTLSGHNGAVRSISFSSDGKILASGSDDGTVKLWSQDGRELKTLRGDSGRINSVVFSRDGKTIVAASDNGTIRIWNQNGLLLRTFSAGRRVHSLDISPDSKNIVTGCDNGTIHLFNTNNGTLIRTVKGHEKKVNRVNYNLDGRFITSASDDGIVKLWNSDLSIQKFDFTTALFVVVIGLGSSAIVFVFMKRLQREKHNNTSKTHRSYIITGWIACVLPEDWRGNLETLRYELISANQSKWYIRFITVTTLLDMLCGGIQIKLENLYDGEFWMAVTGRKSIAENKDDYANHNDSNE
ncbi:hypothetical protein NUACC21_72720 [Scytonema sp. NUACC21]